jgi:methylmalonyl-CoA mutase N-terminal domain/subunit
MSKIPLKEDSHANEPKFTGVAPSQNLSGFDIKTSYGPEDVPGLDYAKDLGDPGQYPYVRGIHPDMYRGRLWTIRQLGSLGSPTQANERIRQLIQMGATGISICLDMPTIMGRDSDDPLCRGEVGSCCGVAIDTIQDMRDLLDGIPLETISVNFVSNSQSSVILGMFCAVAEERGIPLQSLTGTMQNDVLKEYQAQKSYYFPPRPSLRLTMDTITFCARHLPRFNPISISGYHIASAGANPVQELAFTLANGLTYVEEGVKAGLSVDEFAPRLSFFFKTHNDLFENVAKYRAARRIWARKIKEQFGAKNPRSCLFRVHTQTSGSALTAQQMLNNVIRTTVQALAAVLAGTQSLHTNSYDEAFSVPTPRSEKIALRTQQIIAFESGAALTADPLGGSYYVEALTDQMETECYRYFKLIEDLGGVVPAIEKGFFQREISDSAFKYQRSIETKERIIVGLNEFVEDEETEIELRENDPQFESQKIAALKEFKKNRNQQQTEARLDEIRRVCRTQENVMPTITEAVKIGATLGECIGAMRQEFGEYCEQVVF